MGFTFVECHYRSIDYAFPGQATCLAQLKFGSKRRSHGNKNG